MSVRQLMVMQTVHNLQRRWGASWWRHVSADDWGFVSPDEDSPPLCMDAASASLSVHMRALAHRGSTEHQAHGGASADEA